MWQPSCCCKLFSTVSGVACCIDQALIMIGCGWGGFAGVRLCIYHESVCICPNRFAVCIYLVFACIYPDTLGEKARSHPQGSHRPVIVVAKITVIACAIFSLISGYLDSVDISSFTTPPPCKFTLQSGVFAKSSLVLFSCPEQLNRWPCPLVGTSDTTNNQSLHNTTEWT